MTAQGTEPSLDLNVARDRRERCNTRDTRVVELRSFGRLSRKEMTEVPQISSLLLPLRATHSRCCIRPSTPCFHRVLPRSCSSPQIHFG